MVQGYCSAMASVDGTAYATNYANNNDDGGESSTSNTGRKFKGKCKCCGKVGHKEADCFFNPDSTNYRPNLVKKIAADKAKEEGSTSGESSSGNGINNKADKGTDKDDETHKVSTAQIAVMMQNLAHGKPILRVGTALPHDEGALH